MLASEVRSRSDVKTWLLEELELSPKFEPKNVTINGDSAVWKVMYGFRRGFHSHEVFYNTETNQYAFNVSEDADNADFPNFGTYDSYDEMIDGVTDRFASLWKV